MTGPVPFEGGREQFSDWLKLQDAIEAAPIATPCLNFPDAFYGGQTEMQLTGMAKSLCAECPVQLACLRYGVKWEREGVWGGKSAGERRAMRHAARHAESA